MKQRVSLCKEFFIKHFHVYYQPRPGTFMKSSFLKPLQLPWAKLQLMAKNYRSNQRDKKGQRKLDYVLYQRPGKRRRSASSVQAHTLSYPLPLCFSQDAFVAFHNDESLVKKYLKSLLIGELAPDQPSFESNKKVSLLESSCGNGLGFSMGGEGK